MGVHGPNSVTASKMLVREYGTDCPLYTDEDYANFARWLQVENNCLFTVMLCGYANCDNPMKHIDEVKE